MYFGGYFYQEVELAYKLKALGHVTEDDTDDSHLSPYEYLSKKLLEFCRKTRTDPSNFFVRSNKVKYVQLRVAFVHFLPDEYSSSRIGEFFGYDHSTVIHWRKLHSEYYNSFKDYRRLIHLSQD